MGSYNNDVGLDQSPHECERKCEANAAPKTCKYHFYLEWYVTMSKVRLDNLNDLLSRNMLFLEIGSKVVADWTNDFSHIT